MHLSKIIVVKRINYCSEMLLFITFVDHKSLKRPSGQFVGVFQVKVSHLLQQLLFDLIEDFLYILGPHRLNFFKNLNYV